MAKRNLRSLGVVEICRMRLDVEAPKTEGFAPYGLERCLRSDGWVLRRAFSLPSPLGRGPWKKDTKVEKMTGSEAEMLEKFCVHFGSKGFHQVDVR